MSLFKDLSQFNEKHHFRIKKLCEPIKDYLGITCITYNRISSDGKWIHLNNRPDIIESYCDTPFYLNDPFLKHPRLLPTGIIIEASTIYQKPFKKTAKKLDLAIGYTIIESSPSESVILGIAAPQLFSNQLSRYINEYSMIRKFFQYFIQKANSLIDSVQERAIHLPEIISNNFYTKSFDNNSIDHQKHLFIKKITDKTAPELTLREKQYLQCIAQGLTAKQIASVFYLSPRTIENYIAHIKQKLNCYNKSSLIEKALELHALGWLDN